MSGNTRPQTKRDADVVLDRMAGLEQPGPKIRDVEKWRKSIRAGYRRTHWTGIVTRLEAGDHIEAIVAELAATTTDRRPTANAPAITEWTGPVSEPEDGPVIDEVPAIRRRLDQAREALTTTTKPPAGEPAIRSRSIHA